jgi:YD repeat-containing protein
MPSKWSSFISVVFAVVITSASSSLAATTSYTYDATNQLIRVAAEDGTAMEYYYDAVGNRLLTEHYFASIGTFRDGDWTPDTNGNGVLEPGVDRTFRFGGLAPDIPIAGD